MKKIMLTMAVAVTLCCSCGGNKAETSTNEAATDSLAMIDSAVTTLTNEIQSKLEEKDATGVNELLQQAQTYIQQLASNGNSEEAKAYAAKVKEYITSKSEELKTIGVSETVSNLIDAAAAAPGEAGEAVESTANEAKDAVKQTVENAKSAGKEVVDAAKKKVTDEANTAVENAKKEVKEKANKAVEKTKKETTEKANKAIDDAKNKALKGLGL